VRAGSTPDLRRESRLIQNLPRGRATRLFLVSICSTCTDLHRRYPVMGRANIPGKPIPKSRSRLSFESARRRLSATTYGPSASVPDRVDISRQGSGKSTTERSKREFFTYYSEVFILKAVFTYLEPVVAWVPGTPYFNFAWVSEYSPIGQHSHRRYWNSASSASTRKGYNPPGLNQLGIPSPRLYGSLQKENAGEKAPGVSDIRFRSRKRSASGQRPVEQPSCLPQ
jgi:hypothetical protein